MTIIFLTIYIMIHFNEAIWQISSTYLLLTPTFFLQCGDRKFSQISLNNWRGEIIYFYFLHCSSNIRAHCHSFEIIWETRLLKSNVLLLFAKEVQFCLVCLTNCKFCKWQSLRRFINFISEFCLDPQSVYYIITFSSFKWCHPWSRIDWIMPEVWKVR